jgi:bifunctional DNA-binding transcriptional regulator/antitoxin component of YhaV-PrlF toxin-antitoxin module
MGTSITIAPDNDLELVKVVRESLHLEDGDRVLIESRDSEIVIRRDCAGVHLEQIDGLWVVCGGPPLAESSAVDAIREMRGERDRLNGGC